MANVNDDMLKTLRLMYQGKLAGKVNDIETKWNLICSNKMETGSETWKEFYKLIHQFNGSAGSYGFIEVSNCISPLEILVKSIINNAVYPSVNEIDDINNNLNKLKAIINDIIS